MSKYPEGWEFLDDIPEGWEYPEDLHKTDNSAMQNLVVEILSSTFIDHNILQESAKALIEYSEFNVWCSPSGPGRLDWEQMTRCSVELSYITRDVYMAWRAFADKFGPVRRVGVAESERSALLAELRSAQAKLRSMRNAS